MNKDQQKRRREALKEKLGECYSTAYQRLTKDLLFNLVNSLDIKCYRCGFPMTRDTLSIEHKKDWELSSDPKLLFFDLDNVTFSHKACNYEARTKKYKKYAGNTEKCRAYRNRKNCASVGE